MAWIFEQHYTHIQGIYTYYCVEHKWSVDCRINASILSNSTTRLRLGIRYGKSHANHHSFNALDLALQQRTCVAFQCNAISLMQLLSPFHKGSLCRPLTTSPATQRSSYTAANAQTRPPSTWTRSVGTLDHRIFSQMCAEGLATDHHPQGSLRAGQMLRSCLVRVWRL